MQNQHLQLKKSILFSLFFALAQLATAQAPIQDFFHQLNPENKEQLEAVIADASQELGLQFYAITHSQSSPHVADNMQAIASQATHSVFLIINIHEDNRSFGSVLVSNDLASIYTPVFLTQVADDIMNEHLSTFPGSTDVFLAFNDGIEAFLNAGAQIVFTPKAEQLHGFDAYDNPILQEHYTLLEDLAGLPYAVPWKSTPTLGFDQVYSRRIDGQPIPENIRWENEDQILIAAVDADNNKKELFLSGAARSSDTKAVYAIKRTENADGEQENETVGQLNVVSYDAKDLNVVLVSVNGAPIPAGVDYSAELSQIFSPAVVNVHVTQHSGSFNLDEEDFDDLMDEVPSGFLADYTDEMRTIRNRFRQNNDIQNNTYYVFVVAAAEDATALGFMPRARKWGFLYAQNIGGNADVFTQTLAHELGHGAYHLEHIFREYPAITERSTTNLMDYAGGTVLRKYQWDYIDDPAFVLPWGDGDEDGGYVTLNSSFIKKVLIDYAEGDKFVFLNNKGDRIILDTIEVRELRFATGGERYEGTSTFIPVGSLVQFKIVDEEGHEKTYVNCADGNYVKQLPIIADSDALRDPQCTNSDQDGVFPLALESNSNPTILRVTRELGKHVLNIVKLEDYEKPDGVPSFDFYLYYFFNKNIETLDYISQGQRVRLPENTNIIELSPEYGYTIYVDFIEQYSEYVEYDQLSSFYMGALAFIFAANQEYIVNCSVEENPQNLLKNLAETFSLTPEESPNTNFIPPNISIISQSIVEVVAPNYFELLDESTRAVAFNILENTVNRIDKIASYQNALNQASLETLSVFVELISRAEDELQFCELEQLEIEYSKLKGIISLFFDTRFDYITRPFFFEHRYEKMLLFLIDNVNPLDYYDFITFLRTTTVPTLSFNDNFLWQELMDRVDDSWFDSNGMLLIQSISNMCNELYREPGNEYYIRAFTITSALTEGIDNLVTPEQYTDLYRLLDEKVIPYEYAKVLKRWCLKGLSGWQSTTDLVNLFFTGDIGDDWSAYINTTTEVDDQGKINIRYEVESARLIGELVPPTDFVGLEPFEPIVIDPTSSYRTAREFNSSNFLFLPACIFYYLENKASNETVTDVSVIVGSAIVLASGNPAGLTAFGEFVCALESGSAILSLGAQVVDINQTDDPHWQEIRNLMNMSAGAMGFFALTSRGISALRATTRLERIAILGELIDVQNLSVSARVQKYNEVVNALHSTSTLNLVTIANRPTLARSLLEVLHKGLVDIQDSGGILSQTQLIKLNQLIEILSSPAGLLVERILIAGATNNVVSNFVSLSDDLRLAFLADFEFAGPAFWSAFNELTDGVRAWENLHTLLPTNLKHFAADIEHLKFFQHNDVRSVLEWMQANDKMHLFDDYPDLLPAEIVALNYYTTPNGYQINFWLRQQAGHNVSPSIESTWSDAHGSIYKSHLDNAFNKLPSYNSELLLRLEGRTQIEIDALTQGSSHLYPNYLSTAKSPKSSFIAPETDPFYEELSTIKRKVIFEIENNSSAKIIDFEPFSQYVGELEALGSSGKSLEVVSSSQKTFPLPKKIEFPEISQVEFDSRVAQILEDWVTNNNVTIDGILVNPNAISPEDYVSGNYTPERLEAAQKILTVQMRIID